MRELEVRQSSPLLQGGGEFRKGRKKMFVEGPCLPAGFRPRGKKVEGHRALGMYYKR